ncbi:MAG TPA: aspartyl/asparaginyl beta-hydroxylase domain-containing protein [Roseiarcus sp.]|nr:aspartyl/asparaginyl beta-hydroxylase domain-containing protein [Roseiarcus sp.]
MSSTSLDTRTGKDRVARFAKIALRRIAAPIVGLAAFIYFLPKIALLYAVTGAYDVTRNRGLTVATVRRYLFGNGFLTWLLSPLNALLDILSLPYVNKGVYTPEDLPPAYRDEVRRLIQIAKDENLVAQLEQRVRDNARTMIFFRWYGANIDTFLDIPAFHQDWRYIQTIGVSVFNKKVSTSWHFGFTRASLRVLYNLNDITDRTAFIQCNGATHYWAEEKLYIFDDTLLHRSVNETAQTRYCLFVDIIRPTPLPAVMRFVVSAIALLTKSFKFVYYKNWKVIER